jgi:3-oxoacyl-[acyl-carrier protein] reductase
MSSNILVTGVSRGVGLAITEVLLNEGHTVYGVARTESDAVKALKEQFPGKLQFKSVDLSDPGSVHEAVFSDFIDLDTVLHGFVNNAGVAYDDIVTNLNLEPLEAMYRVNVFSPMVLTKYAIRNMILHKVAGSIVHLSSISVYHGSAGLSMYASTKGALEGFSRNIAREWGEKKIRSNCIVAGFMETDMTSTRTEEDKERIRKLAVLKEDTSIESVAETVAFLLSEKACSITGENLHVAAGIF